jgi:hypothetical protein
MTKSDALEDIWLREEAEEILDACHASKRPVVDRLLLTIIDRNPVAGHSREQRLLAAKKALFGTVEKGRDEIDDEELLKMMMINFEHEYYRFIIEGKIELGAKGVASIRELAREIAEFAPGHNVESTTDRLRRKFTGRFLRASDDKNIKYLTEEGRDFMLIARHDPCPDDALEMLELQSALKELGFKFETVALRIRCEDDEY